MPWLSLPDYARQTGTPESTVRAAIRKGQVRAELEQRAPGDPRVVWRVWMDDPPEHPQDDPQPASELRMPSEAVAADAPAAEPPAATTRALELVTALVERNTTLADRIATLEREAGALGSSVDAYRREVDWLKAELERARRSWWRFW